MFVLSVLVNGDGNFWAAYVCRRRRLPAALGRVFAMETTFANTSDNVVLVETDGTTEGVAEVETDGTTEGVAAVENDGTAAEGTWTAEDMRGFIAAAAKIVSSGQFAGNSYSDNMYYAHIRDAAAAGVFADLGGFAVSADSVILPDGFPVAATTITSPKFTSSVTDTDVVMSEVFGGAKIKKHTVFAAFYAANENAIVAALRNASYGGGTFANAACRDAVAAAISLIRRISKEFRDGKYRNTSAATSAAGDTSAVENAAVALMKTAVKLKLSAADFSAAAGIVFAELKR